MVRTVRIERTPAAYRQEMNEIKAMAAGVRTYGDHWALVERIRDALHWVRVDVTEGVLDRRNILNQINSWGASFLRLLSLHRVEEILVVARAHRGELVAGLRYLKREDRLEQLRFERLQKKLDQMGKKLTKMRTRAQTRERAQIRERARERRRRRA